jgi:hypothetical protein
MCRCIKYSLFLRNLKVHWPRNKFPGTHYWLMFKVFSLSSSRNGGLEDGPKSSTYSKSVVWNTAHCFAFIRYVRSWQAALKQKCVNQGIRLCRTRIFSSASLVLRTRWRSWLRHCATSRKVAGSIPEGSLTSFFRPLFSPRVDTACNRNEYQGSCLGGKDGRCVGLTTLPTSCADCLEILGASTSSKPISP